MKEIDKLDYRPFTRFCMSIGAVPTSYLAGLTIEEQLLWLCSYLEKEVIPTVNNNGEAVEELQNLYVELKSYVDNYFDNLDVQEEINNKLDEMVESGELERIINTTFNKFVKTYDTISEMVSDENITTNQLVICLGNLVKGDLPENQVFYINETSQSNYINLSCQGCYATLQNRKLYTEILNLTNLNDLNSYNLTNIDEIIIDKNLNMTNSITFNNKIINLNNKNITLDNENHLNIILENNNIIKNGKIKSVDYTGLTSSNGIAIRLTGDNNKIDNIEFETFYSVYANVSINNLIVQNCILNSFRHEILLEKETFKNIKIINNKQTRAQNYSLPIVHHNNIQIMNKCDFSLVSGDLTKNDIDNNYGENYEINNNEFNTVNTRCVYIINAQQVNITNNKVTNPFGDKTGHTLVGYSDDLFVVDLCRFGTISNNNILNSGENGIDILSSNDFYVKDNKLVGCDMESICIGLSDMDVEGVVNADVPSSYKISENIHILNNYIEEVTMCVRLMGRNITCNNNIMKSHTNYKARYSFGYYGNTYLNAVGNFGLINVKDNAIDINLNNTYQANGNALFKSNDSNIIMDENSGYKFDLSINNDSLATDSSVNNHYYVHSLKFKHVKAYVVDPVTNDLIDLPLTCSPLVPKGFTYVTNAANVFRLQSYKHFVNVANSDQSGSYANLTSGTIKVILY